MSDVTYPNCIVMAAKMMGVEPKLVPVGLMKRLIRVEELVMRAGGILGSRQIVATIIEQYEREAR